MGPAEAVQAHMDLGAQVSVAAHFQVFQLGADGFDDAVNELTSALRERNLRHDVFFAPTPGKVIMPTRNPTENAGPTCIEMDGLNR
jgi:L-ascorbate metabolism protein UlaG (beta-lactamase superfamily)